MGNHDEMNRLIRQKLGLDEPAQNEPAQDEPEPTGPGSADGAAGTGQGPRVSPATRMNRAIRSAWKRRRGKVG